MCVCGGGDLEVSCKSWNSPEATQMTRNQGALQQWPLVACKRMRTRSGGCSSLRGTGTALHCNSARHLLLCSMY